MQFKRLANLIIEAKGEKPGQRFHGAKQAEGPAGISSTPVGRRDFNPQTPVPLNRPVDTKAKAVRDTEKILRNCFRVIKGSQLFRSKLNSFLSEFAKKRRQITEVQEKILSDYPGEIDRLDGKKARLEKIIRALVEDDPSDRRVNEFESELQEVEEKLAEYTEELAAIREQVRNIIEINEDTSASYEEKVIELVQQTAEEEYDALLATMSDREKAATQLKSLDDLEPEMLTDEQLDRDEQRLELLNLLISDSPDQNPIIKFFWLAHKKYNDAKGSDIHFAGVSRRTQNITVEMLYNRLPMSNFMYFYNASKEDLPVRKKTMKMRKQEKIASPIMDLLDSITSEAEFNAKKFEIKDMVSELDIDSNIMNALMNIIEGPYQKRGTTIIQKLKGMLKGILRECVQPGITLDTLYLEVLSKYEAD